MILPLALLGDFVRWCSLIAPSLRGVWGDSPHTFVRPAWVLTGVGMVNGPTPLCSGDNNAAQLVLFSEILVNMNDLAGLQTSERL